MPNLILALLLLSPAEPPRTVRVEYVHGGNATQETFALSSVSLEGSWPGRADRAKDDSGLGEYLLEVKDAGGSVTYSRAFATIFGEWATTPEAKVLSRAFRESVRIPAPSGPVTVAIKKRDGGSFREVWTVPVDPSSPALLRAGAPTAAKVWAVERNGEPADKVDLLLLGDGYAAAEMEKWHRDARRMADLLFAVSPFKERRKDFNVWAVDVPSDHSGVSRPSDGVHHRTALRATYDAFGSERYVLAFDEGWREAAAAAPYEFVEIVVNDRKYGGGGIFGLYATVAADNAFTPYVFVHEFGHHFAGLADEYYTSAVSYESTAARPEPWMPNATADPQAKRWADLLTAGTPLPTPWPKEEFEAAQKEIQERRRRLRAEKRPEEEMEALFREERARMTRLLSSARHGRGVGAFEGANYEAKGYYRPQVDCIMFTRDEVGFCAVCRRAIERVIDLYTRPPSGR